MPSLTPLTSLPLQDVAERAWRYWFLDGLATLVAGLTCLLISGFLLLDRHNGSNTWSVVIGFTMILAYGTALLWQREIVEWLKGKITYPRTGYVEPPYFAENQSRLLDLQTLGIAGAEAPRVREWRRVYEDRKRRAVWMVCLMAGAIIATLLVPSPSICALTGFAMSVGLWIGGRKDQRLTWIVLAGFPLLGMCLTVFQAEKLVAADRLTFFLIGTGVLFVLEGTVNLFRYLRETATPKASDL